MRVESKTETVIAITLSVPEAEVLCALLGGVRRRDCREPWLVNLFCALSERLPDRSLSFLDIFEGDVVLK